ncbi:MAG TPA: hypothetical protein VF373_13440, partial [Prolixibacteraceae bacterium]
RIFERTRDVSALDAAIVSERNAIEAWRQIVVAAGDVYTDDLMMGVRGADLCGHWKDELILLEKGLADLEQKRANFKTEDDAKKEPLYKVANQSDWQNQFQVTHFPVKNIPVGQSIKVSIKVTNPAGIKWVSLCYRSVNQDVEYQTMQMLLTGEKDTFEAIVPANQIDPKFDFMYFIKVVDNERRGIIYPDLNKETPYIIVKLLR